MPSARRRSHPPRPATLKPEGSQAGVKSAVRVMQVLELFDEIQRDAPVSEVVERLGFPQSSTSALLKSLVQTGYLDYLPATRTYVPSARVALLGSWIGGSPVHDGSLGRMMDHLSAETGETIVLASTSGIYARYIHVVQATNPMRLHLPLGTQRLLAWSAMGCALLRDVSDEAIRLLVRRTNADSALARKPVDVRQTLEHVDEFRRRGYFFSKGLVTPGAGLIAMRLPAHSANPGRPLAIGIAGLLDSLEKQQRRLVRVLQDASR